MLADADVDAANLELLLEPRRVETHDFVGGQVASADETHCTNCGVCVAACRFGALEAAGETHRVDALACEGCAACVYACPTGAISMVDRVSGRCFRSETRYGPLFHARLTPGQENSGKLVTQVKQGARLQALDQQADLLLVDGPPGIGCPTIAAIAGADLALLVAEPSVSGIHDWGRILGTIRLFGVPAVVCINKADINPARTDQIRALCAEEHLPLVGVIPFDLDAVEATVRRRPLTEHSAGHASAALRGLWHGLRQRLE